MATKTSKNKLKLVIPWEYLRKGTVELLKSAGYDVKIDEHSYQIQVDDAEISCFISKVEDLAPLVESGEFDIGITEEAFIIDTKVEVAKLIDLNFGYNTWKGAKLVLAVSADSGIEKVQDLEGKKIAAWTPQIVEDYLKERNIKAEIVRVNMPAEAKCPEIFDAVAEFVNSGSSLRKFNLKAIETLMQTTPWLIANKDSMKDPWKKEKIEDLSMLIEGARLSKDMVGLMLHASNSMMEQVFKILPSMKKPTVTQLRGENWFDILAVVDKKELRSLMPQLKKIGCTDIVEFPLNKVIL